MKNYKKASIVLSIILMFQFFVVATKAYSISPSSLKSNSIKSYQLSSAEIKQLKNIDDSLCANSKIILLKKSEKLDDFVRVLNSEFKKQKKEDISYQTQQILKWGLDPQETVLSLEKKAQKYLDDYYNGMKIGSKEFKDMVDLFFSDESFGLAKKFREDPSFGVLYAYMCLYSENVIDCSSKDKSSLTLSKDLYNKKLLQICVESFELDFKTSQSNQILNKYLVANNIKSTATTVTKKLDGSKIQEYARDNAKKTPAEGYIYWGDYEDCTNFVSQALHYGGLDFENSSSVLNKDGVVDTTFEWYFFKKNTGSGYCVSSSFIRVEDLYTYLVEGKNTSFSSTTAYLKKYITPELKAGYILQGKHLWKTRFSHSVIVTITDDKPTYCAHSSERLNEPIETFYDGFFKYRVIHTY
ncbi:hypothetical protein EOL94_04080 [bacterium]|nr:hypothetical protein [bacterium]